MSRKSVIPVESETCRSLSGIVRTLAVCLLCLCCGCGNTLNRNATEQLLTSDAVDHTVSSINFTALRGRSVYLDTEYVKNIKGVGFVNADYIISSLRQGLLASHCALKDKKEDAELVVEPRVGALGTDAHEVTYGIPSNNLLSTASTLVPGSPPIPTIPEISLAKRSDQLAAAKIGVFAYVRETGEPFWQSGVKQFRSDAKDTWVLGVGPFQNGSIYRKGPRFAGSRLGLKGEENDVAGEKVYYDELRFGRRKPEPEAAAEVTTPVEESAEKPPADKPVPPAVVETKPGKANAKQPREPDSSRPNPKPAKLDNPADRQLKLPVILD